VFLRSIRTTGWDEPTWGVRVRPPLPRRRDLIARPFPDRRARLEDTVAGSELAFAVRRLAPGSDR
jgi:hypothetical protein